MTEDIAVVQVAANVVAFGTGVLCASRGLGLWSLIARDAAAGAGTLAGMRVCAGRRMRPGFDRREAAFLLRFGSKMLLSRLGETVFHRLDKLVVGTLVGVGALGLYSQAYLLAETGNRFAGPLAVQVPFGTYARLQHSRAHLSRGYELVNYFLVRMLAFGAVVLALFPRDVLVVLLGWPWAEGAPLLRWLALYACLLPVFDHIRVLLVATGAVWEVVRIRIAQLILFVPVLWFGVKAYGAVGAAVAVDVAMVVGLVYGGSRLRRILDVRWRGLLAPPVLAAACAGGAARWFLSGRSLQEPVARLAAGCGITAGVYVAVLFLLEGRLALGRMRWLRAAWRGGSMETVPCAQRG